MVAIHCSLVSISKRPPRPPSPWQPAYPPFTYPDKTGFDVDHVTPPPRSDFFSAAVYLGAPIMCKPSSQHTIPSSSALMIRSAGHIYGCGEIWPVQDELILPMNTTKRPIVHGEAPIRISATTSHSGRRLSPEKNSMGVEMSSACVPKGCLNFCYPPHIH